MPLRHYWDGVVERIYREDFNVKFETIVSSKGPYFNVRYDFNYITFAFNSVGYLALVEFFLSLFHNVVSLLDYSVVCELPAKANRQDGALPSDGTKKKNPIFDVLFANPREDGQTDKEDDRLDLNREEMEVIYMKDIENKESEGDVKVHDKTKPLRPPEHPASLMEQKAVADSQNEAKDEASKMLEGDSNETDAELDEYELLDKRESLSPLKCPKPDVDQQHAAKHANESLGTKKVKSRQKSDSNYGKNEAEKALIQSLKVDAVPGMEAVGESDGGEGERGEEDDGGGERRERW